MILIFISTEKTILLKCLKIWLDIDLKTILLVHQNNYERIAQAYWTMQQSFNILAASFSVSHNYFDKFLI